MAYEKSLTDYANVSPHDTLASSKPLYDSASPISSRRGSYAISAGAGAGQIPRDPQTRAAQRRARQYEAGMLPGAAAGASIYGTGARYSDTIPLTSYELADGVAGYPGGAPAEWTPNSVTKTTTTKKKWLWGGIIAGILIATGVGVGVGVSVGKSRSTSTATDATVATSTNTTSSTSSTDPSNFTLNAAYHNSFWGIAYEPESVNDVSACAPSLANITRDMQILSQLTTRLHLYGSNCNESAMVLQAIQDTKVNLTVYLAVYVDSNTTAITAQQDAIVAALQTYGTDHVEGITVGNEYILDATDTDTAITYLLDLISDFNATINDLDLDKVLPMGTADAGSEASLTLMEGIDFFQANVHAWFGNVSIDDAAGWTWEYFTENDVAICEEASNSPVCMIGEQGWPSESQDIYSANDGPSNASVANLQTYLDTFVCASNTNGTKAFFFEFRDAHWKTTYGGVEPFWGLFDDSTVLKNITIPDCSHN